MIDAGRLFEIRPTAYNWVALYCLINYLNRSKNVVLKIVDKNLRSPNGTKFCYHRKSAKRLNVKGQLFAFDSTIVLDDCAREIEISLKNMVQKAGHFAAP